MNINRISALAVRIVLQFRRDHRTLALIVGAPIVVLTLLAYLINLTPSPVQVGVVLEDTSPQAQRLAEELRSLPFFAPQDVARDEVEGLIQSGSLEAAVIVPAGYGLRFLGQQGPDLEVVVDGGRSRTAPLVLQALAQARAKVAAAQIGAELPQPQVTYVHAGPEYKTLDYFAPTFVAFFAFLFVYLLTAVGFLRERAFGTLERLSASPLTRTEMVLGYMAGFSAFALVQAAIILLYTVFVIGIHYTGNLLMVFVIVAVLTLGAVNMGILLSTFAKTELQAVQFIPMVITPQSLLAGIFWPIPDMHIVLQVIAHLLPLTYANFALQEVMIKGESILSPSVAADVGALLAFAAVMVVLASMALRRART
ncbi:MAG: ABC transporter permease [Chloroflexi bacterium]|nr:ABC transporter permease [Chloroflexota bacterium]